MISSNPKLNQNILLIALITGPKRIQNRIQKPKNTEESETPHKRGVRYSLKSGVANGYPIIQPKSPIPHKKSMEHILDSTEY